MCCLMRAWMVQLIVMGSASNQIGSAESAVLLLCRGGLPNESSRTPRDAIQFSRRAFAAHENATIRNGARFLERGAGIRAYFSGSNCALHGPLRELYLPRASRSFFQSICWRSSMAAITGISWTTSTKPGPLPAPPRDGDKKQARQRINVEVRTGRRPHPNTVPCADCGHVWSAGERRHEYDHYRGYAAENHDKVQSVCTLCHVKRDSAKKQQTRCTHGHEFTAENTIIKTNGCRACRECRKNFDRARPRDAEYWRNYREQRKAVSHG